MGRWLLYMIQTESGKLYTGITTDLERRLAQHRSGKGGARFFHMSGPAAVVYTERHLDRSSATVREIAIKKKSRKQKLAMIEAQKGREPRLVDRCGNEIADQELK